MTGQESAGATPGANIEPTAREEWEANWPLPLIALLGISGTSMFPTSVGIFMQTLTGRFDWSNTQFGASFLFQVLLGLVAMPAAGRLADRIGARKVALLGIVPYGASMALLGTASGSIWQWWALCLLNALCLACVSPAIWIKPIVEAFQVSRGLALAVALGGIGLATALWPMLAAHYIGLFGWRLAYGALALTWSVPMLIVTALFFAKKHPAAAAEEERVPVARNLLMQNIASRTFVFLSLAGGLYACASYGLFIQFVAILQSNGFTLGGAATILGIFGMSSLVGRVVVGLLLDRLPTRALGAAVFLLPVPATLLLLNNDGSLPLAIFAAALFGLAGGGETDILAYLAAKRFPKAIFASIYAAATAVFAISAATGPLIAGAMFDASQSYTPFLLTIIPLVVIGAVLIWLVPTQRVTLGSAPNNAHAPSES